MRPRSLRSCSVVWWLTALLGLAALALMGRWQHAVLTDVDPANDYFDTTYTTYVICGLFVFALAASFFNMLFIGREFAGLHDGIGRFQHGTLSHQWMSHGLLGEHVARMREFYPTGNGTVSQELALKILRNQLIRRDSLVRASGSLMLTLGLIGTVLGLTQSFHGLSQALGSVTAVAPAGGESISQEFAPAIKGGQTVPAGMRTALQGMALSLITTFVGACFGGVCIKLLTTAYANSAEILVDGIAAVTESKVVPFLAASPESLTKAMTERFEVIADVIERTTKQIGHSMEVTNRVSQGIQLSLRDAETSAQSIKEVIKPSRPSFNAVGVLIFVCIASSAISVTALRWLGHSICP